MTVASKPYRIVIHDKAAAKWLCFENPHAIVASCRPGEIRAALDRVEALVADNGWYAAGFLCYEAAGAFDPALRTRAASPGFPLIWFGLYSEPETFELPLPDYQAYSLGDITPSVSRPEYNRSIERIRDHIRAGDTYQVNYTIRLRALLSGDPWHLFLAMVKAQSPGYSAWVDIGTHAICSASPELFFLLQGNRLTCKPMKGTVHRGRTCDEDASLAEWLRNSEKNRAENLMILDMIRNDLGRVADIGTVRVPALFEIERHPTLWQMTSTVEATCRKPLADIFAALFPCASITGAPKIRTSQIIAELEPDPRGIYCGSIGYVAPGRSAQFNVAIRTAVADRRSGRVEYGAGGGVVWDSSGSDEYDEALLKARILQEKFEPFCLFETMLWTPEEDFFLLDRHLARLAASAGYFGFGFDMAKVRKTLQEAVLGFARCPHRVRLLADSKGRLEVCAERFAVEERGGPVRVGLAAAPVNSSDVFLYHKTTRRRVYESALQFRPDCDDVLLWNERGELTESTIANLVVEMDGNLCTPPVSSGLLPGTFRAGLLEEGRIRERVVRVAELGTCRKIYLINSVRKWREAALL
jgi:para-aminobenzoate synthetase/4-amino-4-deoxychorismate lyase